MLTTLLIVILVLMLAGVWPRMPYAANWGYGPFGVVGVILLIVLILILVRGPLWVGPY